MVGYLVWIWFVGKMLKIGFQQWRLLLGRGWVGNVVGEEMG